MAMRAYRVASGTRIAPFGDPARALHVGVDPLEVWQAKAVEACGLALTDVASEEEAKERPCLLFYDDVFFTEMALRNFVADVLSAKEDAAMALPATGVWKSLAPLQDAPEVEGGARAFDVFYLTSAATKAVTRVSLRAGARPMVQTVPEKTVPLRLPRVEGGADAVEATLTARAACHVRHWLHLLRLSQLSIGFTTLACLRKEPRRILKLWLGRRRDPWSHGKLLNFVDPSARVHPTAWLEGAIVGPGVTIRAHAHVHHSVLSAGVDIGDHVAIMGCTLAERVQVLRGSYLAHCAAMPGGTLASYKVQLALFGRDVFLTSSAWLLDAKLKGEIRVEHEGRLVPIGTPFLGVCLGHRVTVGAQVTIQSGRSVPNGSTLVTPPEQIAWSVPEYPEGTLLVVRDGRVVPLEDRPKTHRGDA